MLVLFAFSFISMDLSFDTLLGVHKHSVVHEQHPPLKYFGGWRPPHPSTVTTLLHRVKWTANNELTKISVFYKHVEGMQTMY